mmetsp:Transcript_28914/g.75828  ORF Transcript_28914/g.75828 Transcript_28914/m.75828 type:complete len:304 (+) Transcript_28914:129-1040(+)
MSRFWRASMRSAVLFAVSRRRSYRPRRAHSHGSLPCLDDRIADILVESLGHIAMLGIEEVDARRRVVTGSGRRRKGLRVPVLSPARLGCGVPVFGVGVGSCKTAVRLSVPVYRWCNRLAECARWVQRVRPWMPIRGFVHALAKASLGHGEGSRGRVCLACRRHGPWLWRTKGRRDSWWPVRHRVVGLLSAQVRSRLRRRRRRDVAGSRGVVRCIRCGLNAAECAPAVHSRVRTTRCLGERWVGFVQHWWINHEAVPADNLVLDSLGVVLLDAAIVDGHSDEENQHQRHPNDDENVPPFDCCLA